jgi:UvrD-like helicase family protein/schlafen family protein
MARMFPPNGPRASRNSQPLNKAEPKIYEALRLRLGVDASGRDTGEYIVFHGVKWFATNLHGGNQPVREMDFLIVSRRHGLLIIEAKSAEIALETRRGVKLDEVHKAYFEQAKTLEMELAHFLAEAPLTCQHMASYRAGSAVWFPFSQHPWPRDEKNTRGVPNPLIFDSVDLANPTAAVERAFAYLGRTNGSALVSDAAMDALIATLDQATLLMQARLSVRAPGDEALIQRLTEEQYATLEALSNYRWLEVPGAAGTGKTVLAYEKAFRLAREGKRALLVCSNPALATWLNEMRTHDARPETAYFEVSDLRTLCQRAPQQGRLPAQVEDEAPEAVRAAQAITELAKQMRRKREPLYDAILVDEAQDFDEPLWKPLQQLMRDQKTGLFYVFYDLAQRERDGAWQVDMPDRRALMPLVANLRNTQEIFKLVARFYPDRERQHIFCKGAQGAPPVYIDPRALSVPSGDPEATALRQALDLLMEVEGIAPQDVLIITCRSMRTSRWYAGGVEFSMGEHTIRQGAATVPGKVALSTVRAARGIERLAVILCEMDGLRGASAAYRDKLLYSAVSRAKHKLIIIGSQAELLGE